MQGALKGAKGDTGAQGPKGDTGSMEHKVFKELKVKQGQ
jgi:hypothetical protein